MRFPSYLLLFFLCIGCNSKSIKNATTSTIYRQDIGECSGIFELDYQNEELLIFQANPCDSTLLIKHLCLETREICQIDTIILPMPAVSFDYFVRGDKNVLAYSSETNEMHIVSQSQNRDSTRNFKLPEHIGLDSKPIFVNDSLVFASIWVNTSIISLSDYKKVVKTDPTLLKIDLTKNEFKLFSRFPGIYAENIANDLISTVSFDGKQIIQSFGYTHWIYRYTLDGLLLDSLSNKNHTKDLIYCPPDKYTDFAYQKETFYNSAFYEKVFTDKNYQQYFRIKYPGYNPKNDTGFYAPEPSDIGRVIVGINMTENLRTGTDIRVKPWPYLNEETIYLEGMFYCLAKNEKEMWIDEIKF